jgi:hypothetical protein
MIPESRRSMNGGQMESQKLGIDHLLEEIFECVSQGDAPDELMGIDLPPLKFDRNRARELIMAFIDRRATGRTV